MAPAPLEGYRIVDITDGIAGSYCTKLLTDGGADTLLVEPPGGHALRRWSAGGTAVPEGEDGALFRFLSASKQSVVADPASAADVERVARLVEAADAVVCSPGARSVFGAVPELDPRRLAERAPHATVVSLTPFGLDQPWGERPATEATLQAMSGGPGGQRGTDRWPPLIVGGRFGDYVTGMLAAVCLLGSRAGTLRSGAGEIVDFSMLEGQMLSQTMYPVTSVTMAGRPLRLTRMSNLPGIHATKDGHVGFMVVTGQQWLDFCAMIERPDWLEDESLLRFVVRNARREELQPVVDDWMGRHTTAEVVELAELFRIPVAELGNGATVTQFDHFVARNTFVENPSGGFLQPAVPYSFSAPGAAPRPIGRAPALGEHEPLEPVVRPAAAGDRQALPLEGIRVADFTAFWAGPFVGNLLGMLGADVIHVESTVRPDGMRFSTLRELGDEAWWEWSPGFQGTNTDKRSLTVDLQTEQGRELARKLVASCDVVVENYSPRVMEGWGLGYEAVAELNPATVMVRMPAFGLDGPWRNRVGYAQTMEQVSGLAWLTGLADDVPEVPNGPCDPVAGAHATVALLLALEHRRRTGEGMLVESPMIGAALNVAAEQVVEHSAYGTLLTRMGNRSPGLAPQGAYRTSEPAPDGRPDRWVVVSVADDEQWQALCRVVGGPPRPGLDSFPARWAHHDELDEWLAAWCAARTSDEVVAALVAAGVPVGKVLLPFEQRDLEPPFARGFFEELDHPVTGPALHSTFPARFGSRQGRPVHRRPSPCLGEHNREILRELGLDEAAIDRLEADKVIGTRPLDGGSAW